MTMTKIPCEIVQDLLPLYVDDICSEATKEAVEPHIAQCEACRRILDQMNTDISLATIEKNKLEGTELRSLAAVWKRSKGVAFLRGLLLAVVICGALIGGYVGLFQWNITTVPTNVVKISDVSQLKSGRIVYHVKMTDGYNVNQVHHKLDGEGNYYVTAVRPVVKSKKFADIGLANTYYATDLIDKGDAQAIYFGTPDDRILIWQKGTTLPAASAEVEAQFSTD